ncbi:MAG: hypothetical protein ACKOW3_09140 [Hyphomicrobium sp.]
MLKISPLEKQAKILKDKLPKKTLETLSFKTNKALPVFDQIQKMGTAYLKKSQDEIGSLVRKYFPQAGDFYKELSKLVGLETLTLSKIVYGAGIYNLILVVCLGLPQGIINIGVNITDHALSKLIAGFLLFTAVIQIFGSRDVRTYGWIIYWEGILRWIAGLLLIYYGFLGHLGITAGFLGLVDIVLGAIYLKQLPSFTRKTHKDLFWGN